MGQVRGGLQGLGRGARTAGRDTGYLNNQIRALGTTMRYALAGTLVFGLTRSVGQLSEIQKQMGLIAAIGGQTGNQVAQTGDEIRQASIEAITPIQDMNNAVINFLSTVNDAPRNQVVPMVTEIAKAATLAQVSAEDATKAFTTMNVAFQRPVNLDSIQDVAQQFFILTKRAPGGVAAGKEVIQQLGQLSAIYAAGRGTPAQLFAHTLGALRFGIPPAQAGRGVAFMAQTLAFPEKNVKEARLALQSSGITSDTVQQKGVHWALMKVLGEAKSRGIKGNFNKALAMTDDEFAEGMAGGPGAPTLGVTGPGLKYLGTVFRRIHALRSALALLSRLDPKTGASLNEDLLALSNAQKGIVDDTEDIAKAFNRFKNQAPLAEGARAVDAMRLQVIKTFEPLLDWSAGRLTGVQESMNRHPRRTEAGVYAAVAGLGIYGASRGLGGLRGVPGRALGIGSAISDFSAEGLGASPQNPMYVIVVAQLTGGAGAGRAAAAGAGAGGAAGAAGAAGRAASRLGRIGRWGVRVGGPLALAGAGYEIVTDLQSEGLRGEKLSEAERRKRGMSDSKWKYLPFGQHLEGAIKERTKDDWLFQQLGLTDKSNRRRGAHVVGPVGGLVAKAFLDLSLKVKQPDGTTEKRKVQVPLVFGPKFKGGTTPSQRGGRTTQRN